MTPHQLLHHHLRTAAERAPESPAVIDGERVVAYGELEAASNRLARLLQELGVEAGDRVGLYLDKGPEAVVALYACLKAGAAYVPIDPKMPAPRARYIVGDCGVRVLVSGCEKQKGWPELAADDSPLEYLVVANAGDAGAAGQPPPGVAIRAADAIAASPAEPPVTRVGERDLAYVLYTSGSTGAPKGVMLTHGNCLAFVRWAVEEYAITPKDTLASVAPFHFDLSTFDLFAAAVAGAPLALMPSVAAIFPKEAIRFIDDRRITVWYSVPSILRMLTEHAGLRVGDLPSLRQILFAGEVFPTKYLARLMELLPHVAFANWYGPTETNVCTHYRVPSPPREEDGDIPIGRPISDARAVVVGDDGRPVAPGQMGELLVGGPSVMQGYWGDPDKTASRLVPAPAGDDSPGPFFRTGDLVEELPAGDFRFLGRRDNQIKSRGYRIELGEIESALYSHPKVRECAVIAVPDELVTNRLVAFVVTAGEVARSELAGHCGERIPRYMIPEAFHVRGDLPKTSTGKVDRRRLGEMI